jgi:hypothetical protein
MASSRRRGPKTTVAKELRKLKAKKRKELEKLAVKLASEASDEIREELVLEIDKIGKWFSEAKAYGRSESGRKASRAHQIKKQNMESGLLSRRKQKVSGGGGPGTGKRR